MTEFTESISDRPLKSAVVGQVGFGVEVAPVETGAPESDAFLDLIRQRPERPH
jgi:hypothetical protein